PRCTVFVFVSWICSFAHRADLEKSSLRGGPNFGVHFMALPANLGWTGGGMDDPRCLAPRGAVHAAVRCHPVSQTGKADGRGRATARIGEVARCAGRLAPSAQADGSRPAQRTRFIIQSLTEFIPL